LRGHPGPLADLQGMKTKTKTRAGANVTAI
jgi:hypothetical protein